MMLVLKYCSYIILILSLFVKATTNSIVVYCYKLSKLIENEHINYSYFCFFLIYLI